MTGNQTFDNRPAQVVLAIFGGSLVVIGLGGFSAGSRPAGLFWSCLGVVTIIRGRRSSSVTVEQDAVVTRSMVRTRRLPLGELERVEVAVGRTGMNGFDREHLVFHRTGAPPLAFKEFNAKPSADGRTTEVQRAAAAIQARLSRSST
jgi:hypothetical protein